MSIAVPAFLTLSVATDDDKALIEAGTQRLSMFNTANEEAVSYYEGSQTVRQFGISVPPSMRGEKTPTGWGGTTVDVLEERLDWLGWKSRESDTDDLGLAKVYEDNGLDVDGGLAHLDALIYGLSFVSVGSGLDGEPSPLVTPHSPREMTGWWDRRRRSMSAAFTATTEDGQTVEATLYRPDETITYGLARGLWQVVDRDQHNLGRVPVVLMPNRLRVSRDTGRSEITKSVRYYVDAATRTLLGLEVSREFYNSPQRVGLNIREEEFTDESGHPISQWTAIQGRVQMIPPNEEGQAPPDIKQFDPASPAPYLDQIKGYAALLASEVGFPAAYLGIETSNPPSADAIRASEARLVKRAERRQTVFGRAWREVGQLALLVRDGVIPPEFSDVYLNWRDASTPTRAATADETSKYVAAGVLPPDSSITYDRMGLSPAEQATLNSERRLARGAGTVAALSMAARQSNAATMNLSTEDALGNAPA